MLDDKGAFVHTHDAAPMEQMLAELGAARPDLVIADHGWAGAAGEAGVPTVAFADSNDPALFVGEAEGKIDVVVPLDDNVLPRYYTPLTERLGHKSHTSPMSRNSVLPIPSFRACIPRASPSLCQLLMSAWATLMCDNLDSSKVQARGTVRLLASDFAGSADRRLRGLRNRGFAHSESRLTLTAVHVREQWHQWG